MIRIFHQQTISPNTKLILNTETSNYILNVLRIRKGEKLILFNGNKGEYSATFCNVEQNKAVVCVENFISVNRESPLTIVLAQGIAKGEKMDYLIKKSIELGVHKIIPIFTEYCNVKLSKERILNRLNHWQKTIISASEQSGRTMIPEITTPQSLQNFVEQNHGDLQLVFTPSATTKLTEINANNPKKITVLIGPEGGLSKQEIELTKKFGFLPITLGPRIMRTETMPIAVISILQLLWGDF